ncbi:MAG: hypothetical protein WC627_06205 [Legionella sp.]|jgi:hypothetical protein
MKKKISSKFYILLLLAFLFAAPGISALWLFKHPDWLASSKLNKGKLLNPPLALETLDIQNKWRIVYWSPKTCDNACFKQLDTLARVRLALGRRLYEVDQWLILGEKAEPLNEEMQNLIKERDFHVAQLAANEENNLPIKAKVFLANSDKYLILSYTTAFNPDDVFKDLKLLLNTTQNKSGT